MTATSQFWCTESLLVTIRGPQGRSTIAVDKPFARIGSHSKSEVLLQGAGIDARCLYLHATPEGIFCVRLLPTQRMTLGSGSWLKPDELLQVGPYEISAQLQSGVSMSPPRVALTAWGSASPPLPVCEISSNGKIRDKRRFRARLNLVGRRRELALQMQGQQVSSCHCALYWDSGRLWCIDLLSSNGTLLRDQPIDCALLEIGQSLQIGEFSLLLKRLSRATVRQSAWRTGESDEDVLVGDADHSEAERQADSLAQTISVASGDTGKAQPNPASPPLVSAPNTEGTQAGQLLVRAHPELRQDQERLQEELTKRSEKLLVERQQLDQQWHQATQEVASQVSHLQSESALLEAQRQEVARLRADWEEQRRILTADLKNLKQELSPRQALLVDPKRISSLVDATASAPLSETVDPEVENQEELSGTPILSGPEMPMRELAGSQPQRGPFPTTGPARTVIEGSFVVEKEQPRTDFPARRVPFPSDSPRSPVPPIGRRHASELRPAAPAPANSESESDATTPVSPVSTDEEAQGLTVVEPSVSSTTLRIGEATPRPVAGRRKQADEDRMGAFVTDRLVLREGTRRFWLQVLWGFAAVVSLLALATLGYIVLNRALV